MLNLVQLQERLKDMPMQALMQYANGANPQVPPFLALGELNRRKKMQEGAAAEQAKEMEGAPTIKEQIEQSAGLIALQGNRQRQAAQQQAGVQAAMPMAAPNTTTSEPAQLAGGGFIDDIVVPRDYQAGGMAQGINPEVIKRLMMLKAMKQRRPGLAGLQTPPDMFKRSDFAGGGIVAFAGPQGSFVETSPGFYQLEEEIKKPDEEIDPQRQLMELIRRLQTVKSMEERKREAGIGEAPDAQEEKLKAVQAEKQRFQEADTIANRILNLDPYRLGPSMAKYEKERSTGLTDIDRRIAEINDLRAKSAYDVKLGNLEKARVEELDAITKEQAIIKDIGDAGYKNALKLNALAGRSSEGDRAAQAYLKSQKAKGDTRPDDVILSEGYMAVFGARGAAAARATTGAEATDVETVNKARDNVDARLKIYTSPEARELLRLKGQDKKNADAGNPTNLAGQYREQLYRDEEAALRRLPIPPRQPGGGGAASNTSTPPDLSKVQGLPTGSKVGTLTAKGWEVFDSRGKLIGHIKE